MEDKQQTERHINLGWAAGGIVLILLVITGILFPHLLFEYELVNYLIIALLSMFVILKSANNIIYAITDYAEKTGISHLLIGFLVMSVGTALPELSTAVIASLAKSGEMVIGNVIGANILNVTVVLGLTAVVGRKLIVTGKMMNKVLYIVLILALLPLLLGLDGHFSRIDGFILLISYIVYIFLLLGKEKKFGEMKKHVAFKDIWKDMFIFLGSIVALLLSARWFILSSVSIANMFHIPLFIMGVIFISLGTSIPDLAIAIRLVLKKSQGVAFGNIMGAIVTQSTFVLGIAAVINPFSFEVNRFLLSALFMFTAIFIGTLFIKKKEITWQEGVGLLLVYITFIVMQIVI